MSENNNEQESAAGPEQSGNPAEENEVIIDLGQKDDIEEETKEDIPVSTGVSRANNALYVDFREAVKNWRLSFPPPAPFDTFYDRFHHRIMHDMNRELESLYYTLDDDKTGLDTLIEISISKALGLENSDRLEHYTKNIPPSIKRYVQYMVDIVVERYYRENTGDTRFKRLIKSRASFRPVFHGVRMYRYYIYLDLKPTFGSPEHLNFANNNLEAIVEDIGNTVISTSDNPMQYIYPNLRSFLSYMVAEALKIHPPITSFGGYLLTRQTFIQIPKQVRWRLRMIIKSTIERYYRESLESGETTHLIERQKDRILGRRGATPGTVRQERNRQRGREEAARDQQRALIHAGDLERYAAERSREEERRQSYEERRRAIEERMQRVREREERMQRENSRSAQERQEPGWPDLRSLTTPSEGQQTSQNSSVNQGRAEGQQQRRERERRERERRERERRERMKQRIKHAKEHQRTKKRNELKDNIEKATSYKINTGLGDDSVKVMDYLTLEEESIKEILKDKDNIVFQSDQPPYNATVTTKEMITNLLYNPDYLEHTKYKCLKKYEYYHFTDINILAYDARAMKDRPDLKFINTRSIGLIGGLFLRSQLQGIIETINHSSNPSRHYVYHIHNGGNSKISIKPIISATNVSWEVKPRTWTVQELDEWRVGLTEASRRPGNMVSSDHCADDESDNFLVTIASVENKDKNKDKKKRKRELSSDGAKKSKKQKAGRRKTKRKKKCKRKTRRKRKNKKTKRRRRK